MDGYEVLRRKAAEKLDHAIQAARKEYRETVDKINALRHELGDDVPPKRLKVNKTGLDAVRQWMPRDRTFTIAEMVQIVKDAEPEIHYTRSTIKSAIYKLADTLELRRIVRDGKGHVVWAVFDYECETLPYATMPLSAVIAELLEGSQPMRPAEIVVAVQKLGCRADDEPPFLLRAVRKSLYANPRRFVVDGEGRWMLAKL